MLVCEWVFVVNLLYELWMLLIGICIDVEMLVVLFDLLEVVVWCGNCIVGSVDCINGLVSSLLMFVCEVKFVLIEEVFLQLVVELVWVLLMLVVLKLFGLCLEIFEGCMVSVDLLLFELVLCNLFDNVLCYSEMGEIVCCLVDSWLVVCDIGLGFVDGDLECVFDCFFIGLCGVNGFGLVFVCYVCLVSGWQVSVCNVLGGGGEVMFDFGGSLVCYQVFYNFFIIFLWIFYRLLIKLLGSIFLVVDDEMI